MPRSRCPVRDDPGTAAQVPDTPFEPSSERLGQRLLRLGQPAALQEITGGSPAGTGDPGVSGGPEKPTDRDGCSTTWQGIYAGICRIRRIRKKLGIRCKQKRRFKITTDSKHSLPVVDNLLDRQFEGHRPNAVWVSDIDTYVPTQEGWLYLAGHKDLFTGEIVGYAMGERPTKTLATQSLLRAVEAKRPPLGLIHHSDRGSQYCSREYRNLVEQLGLRASMSRTGNCYDNAPMESFWGTLKQELVHHRRYGSRREAAQDIREYIEIFYNRQRRQARLGFLSPAAFERTYYAEPVAA